MIEINLFSIIIEQIDFNYFNDIFALKWLISILTMQCIIEKSKKPSCKMIGNNFSDNKYYNDKLIILNYRLGYCKMQDKLVDKLS